MDNKVYGIFWLLKNINAFILRGKDIHTFYYLVISGAINSS